MIHDHEIEINHSNGLFDKKIKKINFLSPLSQADDALNAEYSMYRDIT